MKSPSRRQSHRLALHRLPAVLLPLAMFIAVIASCSEDDDPYPSLISVMADVFTDGHGNLTTVLLDDSTELRVSNALSGFHPNAGYRCVCGYVASGGNTVEVLSLSPAYVLYDCSDDSLRANDPVEVLSVWRGGCRYLNMHLLAKTKGGEQQWGYLVDSVRMNATGATSYHLSLVHDQGTDTLAYSADLYMSVPLDSIGRTFMVGDSISVDIVTWDGPRRYACSLK